MSEGNEARITQILTETANRDLQPAADLLPLVYDQLRDLARAKLAREPAGQTLQPTALVHEAFMRVAGGKIQAGIAAATFLQRPPSPCGEF